MRYSVLGPLEVAGDDGPTPIPARMERLLLALLLQHAGHVVSAAALIDQLWPDEPPRTASKTLQTYVSHLRRLLGDRLRTEPPGYRLVVGDDEVDAYRFERLFAEARQLLMRRDPHGAVDALTDGLSLWRGDAFADLADHHIVAANAHRLNDLRLSAVEEWFDARLEAGDGDVLITELESSVAEYPLRERLWALLMRALYAAGRQADALDAYQRARTILVEELGIEPGPELRATEAAVLAQDASLWPSTTEAPTARYVHTDDGIEIAYVVWGEGTPTVVLCLEWTINVELFWDLLEVRPLIERLAAVGRLIVVQRRDTGQSGRTPGGVLTPPQGCIPDLDAVLAREGAAWAHVVGWGHGGQVALAYAAARPDRVRSIAALTGYARLGRAPDYPHGLPEHFLESFLPLILEIWGRERDAVPIFGPVLGTDPVLLARVARLNRLTMTPSEAAATQRAAYEFDVRALLPDVSCPVLVVGFASSITGVDNAKALADMLPDGRYVELPGHFVPSAEESAAIGDAVYEFFTEPG